MNISTGQDSINPKDKTDYNKTDYNSVLCISEIQVEIQFSFTTNQTSRSLQAFLCDLLNLQWTTFCCNEQVTLQTKLVHSAPAYIEINFLVSESYLRENMLHQKNKKKSSCPQSLRNSPSGSQGGCLTDHRIRFNCSNWDFGKLISCGREGR